ATRGVGRDQFEVHNPSIVPLTRRNPAVAALYCERMGEGSIRRSPLLTSRGGCLINKKSAKPTLERQTGWFYERGCQEKYLPSHRPPGQKLSWQPALSPSRRSVDPSLLEDSITSSQRR